MTISWHFQIFSLWEKYVCGHLRLKGHIQYNSVYPWQHFQWAQYTLEYSATVSFTFHLSFNNHDLRWSNNSIRKLQTGFRPDSLTGVLVSLSSQCPVRPLISQWILTVTTTLLSCLGMPLRVLLSILASHNLWMETLSIVTAVILPVHSTPWSVGTLTISQLKPLTASATALIVYLCRKEQVIITSKDKIAV